MLTIINPTSIYPFFFPPFRNLFSFLPILLIPSLIPILLRLSSQNRPQTNMSAAPLFELPIGACGKQPGGTLTCTEPQEKVYLLTWNSPPDNRLTTPFCKALFAALDILEHGGYAPGVVVTTSGIAKSYSNGFDLEHTLANKDVFFPFFYSLWARFLT